MRNDDVRSGRERSPSALYESGGERVNFAADLRLLGMGLTIAAGLHGLGVRGGYVALTVLLMPLVVFLLTGYIAGRAGMVGTLAMAMGVSLLANPSPLDVGTHGATPELLVLSIVGMLAMMGSSWAEDLRPAPEALARRSLQASQAVDRWSRVDIHMEEPSAVGGPYGLGGRSFGADGDPFRSGERPARREVDRVEASRTGRERRGPV